MSNKSHVYKAIFLPEPLESELERGYVCSVANILKELYVDNVYEKFFLGVKDWVAFDLGAHIGLWSMYASKYCKKIYAIEPHSGMFGVLEKNIKHNGYRNIEPIKVAIANKDAKASLHQGAQNSTWNLLSPAGSGVLEEVECWTMETLFKNTGVEYVDFMKIDVEGAEFGIFGGDSFEKVADRIGLIVGEMHDWAKRNFDGLRWSLKKRGFEVTFPRHDAHLFVARRTK